jgi:hypothetical protein
MKSNITYIISNLNKALTFEWIADGINKQKFNLSFVLLNPTPSDLQTFLIQAGFPVKRINYHGKKSIPIALIKTIFLQKMRYYLF